jgi:hypothetical protein
MWLDDSESSIGEAFQGSDRGLIEVLSWHLLGWTEKNHQRPQDSLWPNQDLYKSNPEYNSRALLLHQPAWYVEVVK